MSVYKQNQIKKVDISLKQLSDLDTTNGLYSDRLDNIRDNQVLVSATNKVRKDVFRFKYLTDLIQAGSGVTISDSNGVLTISASGGGGGGVTSIDVDGGTGISVSPAGPITTSGTFTVTNTAPDQTVVLNNGTGISVTGTYPNFTISSTVSSGVKYGVATGTNTYAVTITGVTSYTDGDTYAVKFTNGNDDDSTININGLGVKTLVKQADIQVTGGDIVSGQELIIIYDGTNFQCIGVAPNQLFAYVTNDDSVTINKGQPVYSFGAAGNRMSVKLASNTADATSAKTIGVVFSTSIAAGQKGFIIIQGVISGVNTAAYSAGATLYLGATAGTLTSTKPYAPNHLVYVGTVERANAGNGQIYVRCQNGYELDEIHDVDLVSTAPVNNDVLTYVTGSPNLWKPRNLTTILGYTPVTNARTISTTSPLSGGGDLTANRTISIADAVADGATKGAASFNANDFNSASGNISIDYANGQVASSSQPGFLSSANWTTFNSKENAIEKIILSGGDVTTTSSTAVDITGIVTSTLAANSTYMVLGRFRLGCNGTGGVKFTCTVPTGATPHIAFMGISATATSAAVATIVTAGTLSGQSINNANTTSTCMIHGTIVTSSTTGTVQFQFASTTSGQTSTIYGASLSALLIIKIA